ncbi:BOI-related E3 ubiquitin-protein ligase 1-like [Aristolochia californica]|uniref:BOI-related E3 ubiquitin-protein ligase 1-like n=1 Tax=Aristolochia californica TaxID=171875 RepID=UPI0035DA6E5B
MFLHAQQPSANAPLMPQISSDLPPNPIFAFPLCEPPQVDRNSYANLAQFNDQGLYTTHNQVGPSNANEVPKSRKRGREDSSIMNQWVSPKANSTARQSTEAFLEYHRCCSSCSSVSGDIALGMQKELEEMDHFIVMQTEKIRAELESKRRKYWSNLIRTVETRVQRVLKGKEEEIAQVSRRNTALEEKLKILLMEGQTWKTLAQTNEAAVMSLRRDLEVAQAREGGGDNVEIEDTLSCCEGVPGKDDEKRNCHGCRRHEVSVLVLPCRHLCICSECDARLGLCPLCMSPKTASIKVHMS